MSVVVKALTADGEDSYTIEVLAIPYGGPESRDSDGEYFTRETQLHLDKFPAPPLVYFHGFEGAGKQSASPVYIGKTLAVEQREDGVWYRAALDKANEFARRVWEAAKQGIARASSGSVAHLVRRAQDGRILEWPVAELSVFDTGPGRQPANRYAVVVPALKSVYAQAGLSLPPDVEIGEGHDMPVTAGDAEMDGKQDTKATPSAAVDEKALAEMVGAQVAAAMKAERDAAAKAAQDAEAQQQRIADAVKAEREKWEAEQAASRRLPGGDGEAPYVAKYADIWQYDGLDVADLAVGVGILNAAKSNGRSRTGASERMLRGLAIRLAESRDEEGYAGAKSAMKAAGLPLKANELNQSTLASYGDEWVSVAYSSQLWDKIRLGTPILGNIPAVTVPQGAESIVLPILGAAPTFYKVAQASAQDSNPGRVTPTVTTSKMGTGQRTLSVGKLGAAVNFTGELEEDSIIPWLAELRRDLTNEAAEILEHVVIDGDTETGATTNINDIAGTPGGTEPFMLFNGFRKLALVTNTANSRSGGTLAVEDYLETVKLLGLAGRNAVDKQSVALITDMHTHWKSLELAEVKTRDVFSSPTVENGMLTNIYGYRVWASANMHRANQDATYGLKANAAGKIDLDTASNNTTGSILAVRWDQWRFGYKRRMTFEVQRDAISDSSVIVVMMRVGMINRDNEGAAISYNITL